MLWATHTAEHAKEKDMNAGFKELFHRVLKVYVHETGS